MRLIDRNIKIEVDMNVAVNDVSVDCVIRAAERHDGVKNIKPIDSKKFANGITEFSTGKKLFWYQSLVDGGKWTSRVLEINN